MHEGSLRYFNSEEELTKITEQYFIVRKFRGLEKPRNFCIFSELIFVVEEIQSNSRELISRFEEKSAKPRNFLTIK